MDKLGEIEKFLTEKNTICIFERPYGFPFLLAIFEAYRRQIEKECGVAVQEALTYWDSALGQYAFFVDFTDFNSALAASADARPAKYLALVDDYHALLRDWSGIKTGKIQNKELEIFGMACRILAIEALTFIIPFIESDLRIPIKNKELVKAFAKARLDSEAEFAPGGPIDTVLQSVTYLPAMYRGFQGVADDFVLFRDAFYYKPEFIAAFKELLNKKLRLEEERGLSGTVAYNSQAKISGTVKVILSQKEFGKMLEGDILVASGTTPDYLPVIKKARAIITDEGGILSHASIVSRELKIPCLVGTSIATRTLKDGDVVEIEFEHGTIKKVK